MKRLTLACALIVLASLANSADLLTDVRARLGQPAVLRGEFEQSKQVAGFKKALLSKGDFLVARERGVIWRTKEPFAGVLKLTPNEIVATQGGELTFRLSANAEPTVRVINGLMFSLLNGDIAALAAQFDMQGSVEAKSWSLTLAPKQAAFAKILKRIELSGDLYVRRIAMDEANGDRTLIQFHKQTPEPAKLSADEAARFD